MLAFTKCCVSFTTDVTANISNSIFVSPLHRIFSPNLGSGIIENVLANVTQAFMFFFLLGSPSWMPFSVQSVYSFWIMNNNPNWGSQFFICCSRFFCDLRNDSQICSYIISGVLSYILPHTRTNIPSQHKQITIQDPFTPSFPAHILSASPIFRALLPN